MCAYGEGRHCKISVYTALAQYRWTATPTYSHQATPLTNNGEVADSQREEEPPCVDSDAVCRFWRLHVRLRHRVSGHLVRSHCVGWPVIVDLLPMMPELSMEF